MRGHRESAFHQLVEEMPLEGYEWITTTHSPNLLKNPVLTLGD